MTGPASGRGRRGADGTVAPVTATPPTQPTRLADAGARADPRDAAREAGLRYSSDEPPGIRRRRAGRGFTYRDPDGERVGDEATLARIRALAIPPAWTDVWICP